MDTQKIVVDANILFSALLRDNTAYSRVILDTTRTFYICEPTFIELFKHKERIVRYRKLEEEGVIRILYALLRHLHIYKETLIDAEIRRRAVVLCQDIDPMDTPQVALTLHLGGLLWTGDKRLQMGLTAKGFTAFFAQPDDLF
jgi:predicted nucleic acid-binding protein